MIYDILLDVGGTGIKAGYFCIETGFISNVYDFTSLSSESKDVIINRFVFIFRTIWNKIYDISKKIRNIKMAFPGPFDYINGISKIFGISKYEHLYNISIPFEMAKMNNFENLPFIPNIPDGFIFINDIEAYALGCMDKYKIFKEDRVLYLCIGTGAGSAYSINKKISTDINQGIAHNGWIYDISYKDSIIDDYISARGISKLGQKYFRKLISPLELSNMVKNGNLIAKEIYKEFGNDLDSAIIPIIRKFRGNKLFLGGNISNSSELFIDRIRKSCIKFDIDIIVESNTSKMAINGLCKI